MEETETSSTHMTDCVLRPSWRRLWELHKLKGASAREDDVLAAIERRERELQAEHDRRRRIAVARSGDDDGQPKSCSWFGCAPACNYAEGL